jgi:hypothetical protein
MKTFGLIVMLCMAALNVQAGLDDSLSTTNGGLVSGGNWANNGFTVLWVVNQVSPDKWNYQYTFKTAAGEGLSPEVSHFIISVSADLTADEVFNFTGDLDVEGFEVVELKKHSPGAGNPSMPGDIFWGLKIELNGAQTAVAFDSTRAPMWGDFYAKGGPDSYACNTSFGVAVLDPHDYDNGAVDANGNALFKVLVPNTIPEPATMVLLGLGGVFSLISRKRKTA